MLNCIALAWAIAKHGYPHYPIWQPPLCSLLHLLESIGTNHTRLLKCGFDADKRPCFFGDLKGASQTLDTVPVTLHLNSRLIPCLFQIYPDPDVNQEIMTCNVRCTLHNQGCTWVDQLCMIQVRSFLCLDCSGLLLLLGPKCPPRTWSAGGGEIQTTHKIEQFLPFLQMFWFSHVEA